MTTQGASRHPTRTQVIAWSALLALAALQGWVFRHTVQPDGIAYLDLSDSVARGRFPELVNGYWSPLYPAMLGITRLMVSATPLGAPYYEFALAHVLNFAAFALSLVTFEWFLRALNGAGEKWGHQPFASPLGRGVAYLLFGGMSLVMISLKAVTPDLLVSAITFAVFASLLRLREDPSNRGLATALGLLLAAGALTKAFLFPFALVVLLTLALFVLPRERSSAGRGGLLLAGGLFLGVLLPWILAVSVALGRPTLGDTGALNYAWWVNNQAPPQSGVMPTSAAPRDSLPLDGLAVMPNGRGTNPLWYDPVHWNAGTRPHFSLSQQSARLSWSLAYYIGLTAPLLFVALMFGGSVEWRDVRSTILRSYPILLPSVAALAAYALVLAAARYLAPYLIASTLALAAAFPRTAMLRPSRMVLATSLGLLAIDALSSMRGRVFLTYGVALFVVAWFAARARTHVTPWKLAAPAAIVLLWLIAQLPMAIVQSATLVAGLLLWVRLSRTTDTLAGASARALRRDVAIVAVIAATVPGILDGYRAISRWTQTPATAANEEWSFAQRAIGDGAPPGSKIAVLGSPYEVGWARLARFQIVGVVPENKTEAFWKLNRAQRASILRAFSEAGAIRIIANPRRAPY